MQPSHRSGRWKWFLWGFLVGTSLTGLGISNLWIASLTSSHQDTMPCSLGELTATTTTEDASISIKPQLGAATTGSLEKQRLMAEPTETESSSILLEPQIADATTDPVETPKVMAEPTPKDDTSASKEDHSTSLEPLNPTETKTEDIPPTFPPPDMKFLLDGVVLAYDKDNSSSPIAHVSSVVELSPHCRLPASWTATEWADFASSWARPLWNTTTVKLLKSLRAKSALIDETHVWRDVLWQLVEMYSHWQTSWCNWDLYRPTVHTDQRPRVNEVDIVFLIYCHHDFEQLQRLVQALMAPSANRVLVILHVDDHVDPAYLKQVQGLVDALSPLASDDDPPRASIFLLQFGEIRYTTDSLSMIHYRILYWLHHDAQVTYSYHVGMDGNSYPLQRHWPVPWPYGPLTLGFLTAGGNDVRTHPESSLFRKRRVMYGSSTEQLQNMAPKVSPLWQTHLVGKSLSGNQGLYTYAVDQALVAEPHIRHLFALAKYGCCCCLEERSWMGALSLLGYREDVLRLPHATFQTWGGGRGTVSSCKRTMKNAVLSHSEALCFLREDDPSTRTFVGNATLDALKVAQQQGVPLARKFSSRRPDSMELLRIIQEDLWDKE